MTEKEVLKAVQTALRTSELLRSSRQACLKAKTGKSVTVKGGLRALRREEVSQLEAQGNWAEDWKNVHVSRSFRAGHVVGCRFFGTVVLGEATGTVKLPGGVSFRSGCFRSTLQNAEVGDGALVSDVALLTGYLVKSGAAVFNCGTVACSGPSTFGVGTELSVAIETGGREVLTYAEITVDVAAKVATSRANKAFLKEYASLVGRYVAAAKAPLGTIDSGATVANTTKVLNSYVGRGAVIDGAQLVRNSTLLAAPDEATQVGSGAYVTDAIIQWGSVVTSMAIIDTSVLTEHSHVERHGMVTQSLLGPNTGVAEGEVTASLCGPFVGFHHQALLIAAFWPEGKGNVGYGANVGSNHTSKAPDQEIWPGEGIFFGLGANIKFPADFSKAPYTIIASGVATLPQKVTFPFSLINTPSAAHPGLSPAYNEIVPAWVLSDNLFTIRRNEGKYKARNKARRSSFDFEVLRPDIVDMMLDARTRLRAVSPVKELYTDKDIPGLGKNYMLERSRLKAIDTYTASIRYYALLGLRREVATLVAEGEPPARSARDAKGQPGSAGRRPRQAAAGQKKLGLAAAKKLLVTVTRRPRWEHERELLLRELPDNDVPADLRLLIEYQERIAREVEESKRKDDIRGARVIDDYAQAHTPAEEDSFVKQTWAETKALQEETEKLLADLA